MSNVFLQSKTKQQDVSFSLCPFTDTIQVSDDEYIVLYSINAPTRLLSSTIETSHSIFGASFAWFQRRPGWKKEKKEENRDQTEGSIYSRPY